ncbi:MAG: bifunctional hydroxymethylpyrimidine kinase/phosphomethylpyrimidine kinase [Acidimicrobiia bacterium]|nr:bifunctional hydroxymethylpyrimidine kinase/phosphomethylpyrimidine kinase [Acidimicrobiia bacterium]
MTPRVVVTIAGSDSAGGAGLQADLRTFAAHGVHGATVITVVTAQNTRETRVATFLDPEVVRQQLHAVVDDMPIAAVKTGMLGSVEVIEVVAEAAEAGLLPDLVVDPVLVDASGRLLFPDAVVERYVDRLFPLAVVVTPNIHEAALLVPGVDQTVEGMERAAAAIGALGPRGVVVKGGRLGGVRSPDVAWTDGQNRRLPAARIKTPNDHGTGCSLAAAIAANLAAGRPVDDAIDEAKAFVTAAIASAASWRLGGGHGPIDHLRWSS